MRKVILVCAMIFVGTINCMETTRHIHFSETFWEKSIPFDVKEFLDIHIKHYDNFVDAVNVIKAIGHTNPKLNKMINERYGDQDAFTALIHILANKFGTTPNNIAKKFETEASRVYLALVEKLIIAIMNGDKNLVVTFINDGADINFIDNRGATPLGWAVRNSNIVKILLDAGAQVRPDDITILSNNIRCYPGSHERSTEQFKSLELLEKALQEQKRRQIID